MSRWWHVIALFLLLLPSACTKQETQTIRVGMANLPLNLDPRFTTDATSERINRLLYQRLVEFGENSLPVPGIASWQILSSLHYRFTLNETAGSYNNGRLLTVDDVIATYRYVLNPANISPRRDALSLIDRFEKIDETSFDVHLTYSDPLLPAYMTLDILPADYMENDHSFERVPVGSGLFAFVSQPDSGKLLLERRIDGQEIELLEVKNPTVRVLKLLRGEIDLLQNYLSPELLEYSVQQNGIEMINIPGTNFTYIGFNLQDAQTADLRVRQAVAHAIDRQSIIDEVMRGAARKAETIFPPEHWAGHNNLTPYDFDPEKSRRLLLEAGYGPNNPLTLVYKTSSDPFRIRLATIIQDQLSQVGIQVDLKSYDWGTFFGDIKAGNFQIYSLSWVGIRTPDIFRYVFSSDSLPPAGANRGRYTNPVVDALLKEAEQAETLEAQTRIYQEVAAQIHKDLPYVPLWFEGQYAVQGSRVTGYRVSPNGNYDGLNHLILKKSREFSHAQAASAH
ncbi:MAG: ABC transporter substrate-binding protein [Candidatus Thiodiazotropha sp. (ex Notomyrtea botanica)]|nr:ABC transporter substrate-binding protein [Candidatus Thiodiazotropha sp. (ex Notomyrtea botanica)]